MKKLFNAAAVYTVLGLAGGLYYRTLTHANNFTGDTQLSVVHTHFLVLGTLFFLLLLPLEYVFGLSRSKLFNWFFWTYNVGLIWTVGFLTFNGTQTVLGNTVSPAISGIAGFGHVILTAAFVLFFLCLRPAVLAGLNGRQNKAVGLRPEISGSLDEVKA